METSSIPRKKIAIDIDDVLGDCVGGLIKYCQDIHNRTLARSAFVSYHFERVLGGPKEAALEVLRDYTNSSHFAHIEPLPGAKEGVADLQRTFALYCLTSRRQGDPHKQITLDWLARHFPDSFCEVCFGYNEYTQTGPTLTKAQICAQKGIDWIVEDSLENALRFTAESATSIILIDAPWNQSSERYDHIQRVKDWLEVVRTIRTLENRLPAS